MQAPVQNTLAVLGGLLVGSALNMTLIMVSWELFPGPEGFDRNDPAQLDAYVAGLPLTALLLIITAHLAQALGGGWLAARLAASRPLLLSLIVGALSMAGGVANMFMIEHPAWMWVEVPLYLAVAWVAGHAESKRRAAHS